MEKDLRRNYPGPIPTTEEQLRLIYLQGLGTETIPSFFKNSTMGQGFLKNPTFTSESDFAI